VSDKEPCILCGVNEWPAGVKFAEERIIKLLKDDCELGLSDLMQGCHHDVLIALIKEENTDKANVHTSADNAIDDIYDGVMYGFIKRAEFKQRLIALIKGESQKDNETVVFLTGGENK
jgi:hypothetical protein